MRQILSKLVIVLVLGMAPVTAAREAATGTNLRDTYLEIAKKQQQQKNFVALTPEGASVELVGLYNPLLRNC